VTAREIWDGLLNSRLPGTDSAYILPMGEAPRVDSLNLLFGVLARSKDTAGAFSMLEIAGARGAMAPAHSHGTEAEAFYVLDGRMNVHVADQSRGVAPGDFVYIPRATRHACGVRLWRAGLDLRGHLGQQELQVLEVRDRLAELLPLLGIADRPGARRERAPYRAMNRISSRV